MQAKHSAETVYEQAQASLLRSEREEKEKRTADIRLVHDLRYDLLEQFLRAASDYYERPLSHRGAVIRFRCKQTFTVEQAWWLSALFRESGLYAHAYFTIKKDDEDLIDLGGLTLYRGPGQEVYITLRVNVDNNLLNFLKKKKKLQFSWQTRWGNGLQLRDTRPKVSSEKVPSPPRRVSRVRIVALLAARFLGKKRFTRDQMAELTAWVRSEGYFGQNALPAAAAAASKDGSPVAVPVGAASAQ